MEAEKDVKIVECGKNPAERSAYGGGRG